MGPEKITHMIKMLSKCCNTGNMASSNAEGICKKVYIKPLPCPYKSQYKFLPSSENPVWSLLFFMPRRWGVHRTSPVTQAFSFLLYEVENQIKLWSCNASVSKAVLCTSCLSYKKIPGLCLLAYSWPVAEAHKHVLSSQTSSSTKDIQKSPSISTALELYALRQKNAVSDIETGMENIRSKLMRFDDRIKQATAQNSGHLSACSN